MLLLLFRYELADWARRKCDLSRRIIVAQQPQHLVSNSQTGGKGSAIEVTTVTEADRTSSCNKSARVERLPGATLVGEVWRDPVGVWGLGRPSKGPELTFFRYLTLPWALQYSDSRGEKFLHYIVL